MSGATQHLVALHQGQATTISLLVAEKFGKKHRDVLRAIRNLECSEGFRRRNFAPANYLDEQKKPRPMVLMTRDGFSIVAMGFTGAAAMQWKESFLAAFNALMQGTPVPLPTDTPYDRESVLAECRYFLALAGYTWRRAARGKSR